MREEFSTLFPLCKNELALSTRPGAEAREKRTLQEKLAFAGIRTPDLTSRRFRSCQLGHRGGRSKKLCFIHVRRIELRAYPWEADVPKMTATEGPGGHETRDRESDADSWHTVAVSRGGFFASIATAALGTSAAALGLVLASPESASANGMLDFPPASPD
ncbi:unnamed protein product [Ectocarpus sp. CCAP 1310/34]|nr:unnamed protein product [Ectocarpus sp. CCAP 1310/34]